MSTVLGRLGSLGNAELESLPEAMVRLITRTIESSLRLPVLRRSDGSQKVVPPPPYSEFVEILRSLSNRNESVAIISFNYDLALDYALYFHGVRVNYCIGSGEPTGGLPLMKLHGSMNWGRCPKCKVIVPWQLADFFSQRQWSTYDLPDFVRLDVSAQLPSLVHCDNNSLEASPVVVPPTWNKGKYHDGVSDVWRAAATHLSEAERIFVIGYSLPKTDEFFKYFYALGSVGESIPSVFCVINSDPHVSTRFKDILGPTAASMNCFRPLPARFEDCFQNLASELDLTYTIRAKNGR
jgi:hypothetical protein